MSFSLVVMFLALASSATFNPEPVGAIPAPANDDFPGTTVVGSVFFDTLLPVSLPTGNGCAPSLRNADTEPGEPTGPFFLTSGCPFNSFINSTVWYSTTPRSNGFYVVDTSNSSAGTNTLMRAYTGSSVSSLTPVPVRFCCGGQVFGTSCGRSQLLFCATAGTTYRIQVGALGNCASPPSAGQIWRVNIRFTPCN
jgi:hypothetical protein